jgi:SAM-dependent methyltransferase
LLKIRSEIAAESAETSVATTEPSDLGKKSHWDNEFARDLAIFRETGDPGYAWFEEQLGSRLVSFFDGNSLIPADARTEPVLDVGCGNGQMLKDLHDLEYTRLFGVDYSEPAVNLCKEFLVDSSGVCYADLREGDISALPYDDNFFAIVHDKGTYDAWRLGDHPHEAYMIQVHRVLRSSGLFVLSCVNWTADEMRELFTSTGLFEWRTTLKGASFQYGGVTGHNVTTAVFSKRT